MRNNGVVGLSQTWIWTESDIHFNLIDMNRTVLHNFLWFHFTKATKSKNELTFLYELFQDNYGVIL